MQKKTTLTSITPLPASMSREQAISYLHDHAFMIDLNPLVRERHQIPPPDHAHPEEQSCDWYSITDRIYYLPGISAGDVAYTCAFHDMPWGLQTHCHAPMGLDIRDKWSVGGSLPGETPEPQELGLGAPSQGLYLREDVVFKCNFMMAGFVKKTLKKSHGTLVERMAQAAEREGGRHITKAPTTVSNESEMTMGHGNGGGSVDGYTEYYGKRHDTFVSDGPHRGPAGQQAYQSVPGLYEAPEKTHTAVELPSENPPSYTSAQGS